jgi:lysine-specific permease
MIMMSLGGSIGTGLFVGSGAVINQSGPLGAILAYVLISIIVYFIMQSLGEMATLKPVTGSFNEYARLYVSESFGVAAAWSYWFNWAITIAVELSASSLCMLYWFPNSSFLGWSISFFIMILSFNLLPIKFFGEIECFMSAVKVTAILIFILIGLFLVSELIIHQDSKVLEIDKGHYLNRGVLSFISTIVIASFSFQGTELVGVTSGECEDPVKDVPKAINSIFWRLMLFGVLVIIIISLLIPYNSPYLLNSSMAKIAYSPFTLLFKIARIPYAGSVMNFIILSAILSACSTCVYTSSRTLWYLSKTRKAPKVFGILSSSKVPVIAVFISSTIGMASFLASKLGLGFIFIWLINISSLCGLMTWLTICVSHLRFRKALIKQGYSVHNLPFKAKFFPIIPILPLVFILIVIIGQGLILINSGFSITLLISTYIGVIFFLVLFVGHKILFNDKKIPLSDCDFKGANFQNNKY